MYTTSSGLEALYYSNRKITDADGLRDLIKVYLEHQIGPADSSALGNSYEYIQRKDLQNFKTAPCMKHLICMSLLSL